MDKRMIALAIVGAALLGAAGVATAATSLLYGQRMTIKNKLPEDESKNKIVFLAKDPQVVAGALGSSGDPTCSGAGGGGGSLTVTSQYSGQTFTTTLPCTNWRSLRGGRGYKYSDRRGTSGPCKSVQILDGKLAKASCLGKGAAVLGFDLQLGVPQNPVDVSLRIGTAPDVYCLSFGGVVRKNGTDAKTFLARSAPPPVVLCSPSGAFLDGTAEF